MTEPLETYAKQDVLDNLLEEFEQDWRGDRDYLADFLQRHNLESEVSVASELIRVDIDRRYHAGHEVELGWYFETFPFLNSDAQARRAIAFEDFRARNSRGLAVPRERWGDILGTMPCTWYQELPLTQPKLGGSLDGSTQESSSSSSDVAGEENAENGLKPQEPTVGERFGDFQLVALLGTGAFSRVFLAQQESLAGRYVAVKIVKRALEEPVHLARLQHTGIVPLYSFHVVGSYSVLCMPYYGSATLADWYNTEARQTVRNGQSLVSTVQRAQNDVTKRSSSLLPSSRSPSLTDKDPAKASDELGMCDPVRVWNAAGVRPLESIRQLSASEFSLWLAERLAAGLAHAHERNVVHGDLKPANILLRNDGEPALIDFNLSRNQSDQQASWVGGTLPYMAPEQLKALVCREPYTSPVSDVYSLGLILFEIIEGSSAFPAPLSTAESDLTRALEFRSQRPTFEANTSTQGLQQIILKCLSLNEAERYLNAAELLDDLKLEIANLPLRHARESWLGSRIPKLLRRHPRLFSAAPVAMASLVLLAVVGLFGGFWYTRAKRLNASQQVQVFEERAEELVANIMSVSPEQWPELNRSLVRSVEVDLDLSATGESQPFDSSRVLRWLPDVDRNRARGLIFDSCLASLILSQQPLASRAESKDLQSSQESLLGYCEQFQAYPNSSRLLSTFKNAQNGFPSTFGLGGNEGQAVSQNGRPLEIVLTANKFAAEGRSVDALQLLGNVKSMPNFRYLMWVTMGRIQMQQKQYTAARLSFSLAANERPEPSTAWRLLASADLAAGDLKTAVLNYTEAIRRSPKDTSLLVNRALARERLTDITGAINDMTSALELEPDSNRYRLIRSRLLATDGKEDAGRSDFHKALNLTPARTEDWISRALVHLRAGRTELALSDLQSALAIEPDSVDVLQNLAHVYAEHLNRIEESVECLDHLLDLHPQHEMARGGRCVLHARLGDVEATLTDLKYLIDNNIKLLPATVYQMACAHTLLIPKHEESKVQAHRLLTKAVRLGYGIELLEQDPDLANIRDTNEFDLIRKFVDISDY